MGLFKKERETVVNGAVDLVKNVRGMIDDSRFTAEEQSRFNAQMAEATANFTMATLSESTVRSITRRFIAVGSIYFFYLLILILIVLWKFDPEWFIATKDLLIEFKMPVAFLMVMAFFFGGYYAKSIIGKFIGDKADKK